MDPLFPEVPENFADLTDEQLLSFIEESEQSFERVRANPASHVGAERTMDELIAEMQLATEVLRSARAEYGSREETPEIDTSAVEALAAEALSADAPEADDEADGESGDEADAPAEEESSDEAADDGESDDGGEESVEASVELVPAVPKPVAAQLARPARARRSAPAVAAPPVIPLTATAPNLGPDIGARITRNELGEMLQKRRRDFGNIPEGTSGEKIPLAKMDWSDMYGSDRRLGTDEQENQEKIAAFLDTAIMRSELERRKGLGASPEALVAAGGLCAPVTPYYDLQVIATNDRPVRAALPSFNAVRGGIRFGRPAGLGSITTAVGDVTAQEDALGGTFAAKTCQVVACPAFSEVDVRAIFHCIQFGNLPSRTFPELLAQWTELVLAAHARLAETDLLMEINNQSTPVTVANATGLGASSTLPSQILEAAAGIRSRNRMAPDAVLRVLLPAWSLDLLVSDMYRTQFQRFDMSKEQFVAILRAANVEPSFYIDGPPGQGQVFGTQAAGALLSFPSTVTWYIFPEGSFLYLDGGTLELGLVRDSVLNATNDFQIFGETFENVAFIGLESLRVQTSTCDSGAVTAPNDVNCPVT